MLYAPFDGKVDVMFETGHAVGLVGENGVELLVHIGIDTVNLEGKYFSPKKAAGIFVSKKLTLTYESISQDVLTDEKWLGFVIGQILSNALKYTRTGGIRIYLEKKLSLDTDDVSISIGNDDCNKVENLTLVIEDTGIGIRAEDIPRIFEKGYTGVNGRDDNRATGIGLYLSNKIMRKLGHRLYITSTEGKGTKVFLEFSVEDLNMY